MASNINAFECLGLSPGLQDLLHKQELQFNLFQQENERSNASLRREIDVIKQRLNNLEIQPPPNPTSMLASSNSFRETGEHESMNRDNINSIASKSPSDTNTDAANGELVYYGTDQSEYEILNEQHLALKMEYQMLKYQTNNPNCSMASNSGELAKTQVAKCDLERQVVGLRRELQLSRDSIQTLQIKNEKLKVWRFFSEYQIY